MCDQPRFVTLRSGLVLPLDAMLLALRLEAAGFKFMLDPTGALMVAPFDQLDETDLEALRRWRLHLVALMLHDAGAAEVDVESAGPDRVDHGRRAS